MDGGSLHKVQQGEWWMYGGKECSQNIAEGVGMDGGRVHKILQVVRWRV